MIAAHSCFLFLCIENSIPETMKHLYLFAIIFAGIIIVREAKAAHENENANDTIKTYTMNEVIITSSTKETNNLRTLPGSVTVLSPLTISGNQIESVKDLSSYVPNFFIPDYGSKMTSAVYIRGIGTRSSGQSVGLYVDDAPYLDKSTFEFGLTDIQCIGVLRGPQGTLYGRNAMGGIINIYTLSPFEYQGTKLSLSAGNYGQFKAKASHYNKINEKLGISIGGYYDRNDGYFTNEYNGKRADNEESAGGRFKLDWLINPRMKASYTFSLDYTKQGAFPYGLYDPATKEIAGVNINDPSSYNRRMIGNQLHLEYKANRFTLSSTTGYRYFKDNMSMDQDFSPLSLFTLSQKQKQNALSQEITLKSNQPQNYQWSFGAYGFYDDLHIDGPVTFKQDGVSTVLQSVFNKLKENNPRMPLLKILDEEIYIPGSFDTPTYGLALYHQSTYNNLFTDGLSITAGVRLDYEKAKLDYYSEASMNFGMQMAQGMPVINLPALDPSVMEGNINQDFWQVLPKLSLKYECTPSTLTYLSVARGYKAGGYNVQMFADLIQDQLKYDLMSAYAPSMAVEPSPVKDVAAYKPEYSWNYEAGIRSELINKRLSAELSLFWMDLRNIQLTKFVNSGNGRIITNGGKAQSYGAEVSLRARLATGLTADLSYGYTHATFRNYIHEEKEGSEIIQTDYKGNHIPYTPGHTLSAGVQYIKLFKGKWLDQVSLSGQYTGAGKIWWTEKNDIGQDFYGTINAKAGVRKGNVKLDVWTRNLLDASYAAFYFESFGKPYMQKGKPFQLGAEISVAF